MFEIMVLNFGSRMLLFSILVTLISVESRKCPCSNLRTCDHQGGQLGDHKEIFAYSRGTSDLSRWKWDSVTAFISPPDFDITNEDHASTLCETHEQGRKFGVSVEVSLRGKLDKSSDETQAWISSVLQHQSDWFADVLNIDFLPYFKNDIHSTKEDHIELALIMKKLKDDMHNRTNFRSQVEISCMVPWKPPCAEKSSSCDFSWISLDVCDFFVLSADSFMDFNDDICKAGATIPFAKLFYGISEYASHSVPMGRVMLGVPWHGYDYTCKELTNEDVCLTETKKQDDHSLLKCDFNGREMLTMADLLERHPEQVMERKHKNNDLNSAPYFNYKGKNGSSHQVWFEDNDSLRSKYKVVAELKLKGLALMYGDDLISKNSNSNVGDGIWSWLAHEHLLQTAHKTPSKHDMHTADTVAGLSVGCLLLGVILGVVFTCLALRYRVKKPRNPFEDETHMGVGYTDEDPNL